MYITLISIAVGVGVGVGGILVGLWDGWLGAILFGLLATAVTWIVVGRKIRKRLEPALLQVRKQAEAGLVEPALRSLQDLLPMGKWMPMLSGQIYAQMGALSHYAGHKEQAMGYLEKAALRAPDAQALRACLLYKSGDKDRAKTVLEAAALVNKRHALLHNLYAWILHKEGQTDEAMVKLNRHLKKEPSNEASQDNLLRLQNGKKLNMKRFGMEWYALGLERPPASMGQMRVGRKGFRQPPKKRGGRHRA